MISNSKLWLSFIGTLRLGIFVKNTCKDTTKAKMAKPPQIASVLLLQTVFCSVIRSCPVHSSQRESITGKHLSPVT